MDHLTFVTSTRVAKSLIIQHLVGFPIDFNGNLQRALFEAIHVAKHGNYVNLVISEEVIREGLLSKSIPKKYLNLTNLKIRQIKPLMPNGIIGWRINNLIALPAGSYKSADSSETAIIHVHAPTPVTKPFSSLLIKKLQKRPMLLDLHDPWSGQPFSRLPIPLFQTSIMKYVIRNADVVIAPHKGLINLVRSLCKKKTVALIPNGVDTEIFKPIPRSTKIMRMLNLNLQDPIVAFSGHITPEKGLDDLVYAAKILIEKNQRINFLILGGGPMMMEIKTLVHELKLEQHFIFTGFIDAEMFHKCLSMADICVCPYKPFAHYNVMQIETPLKVVQYMAMAKPVIMSKVSEENVVKWGDSGLLTDPGNPKALAEAIIYLIENDKERQIMGRNGREYVEKKLGWNTIANKLIKIYESLQRN